MIIPTICDMVTIPRERFESLLIDEKIVDALDMAGVDYWTIFNEQFPEADDTEDLGAE